MAKLKNFYFNLSNIYTNKPEFFWFLFWNDIFIFFSYNFFRISCIRESYKKGYFIKNKEE
jgi:hypothetical protein